MFTTNVALLIAIEPVISFFYALICDQYHELQIDYFVQHFHLIMNIAQLESPEIGDLIQPFVRKFPRFRYV